MAVDISTDLNITLLAQDISTPTISGTYDVGSPAGTYVPGKDFSPIDNVSTGTTAELNFSIAFDSISNQLYTLDRVYTQSVDDPRTDGAGQIPARWINTLPDPTDIIDDGGNVIIPGSIANMSSIVFDSTANIRSDSTVTTGITVTLPLNGFWWKSKLMPNIQVVAVKDGISKVSAPLQLPTILLSSAAILQSLLTPSGDMVYSTLNGQKGFFTPFTLISNKTPLPNISALRDDPDYGLITYQVNYNALVNGTAIPLTAADFPVFNLNNGTLESLTYAGGVLTVVMRQTNPGTVGLRINAFVPFDAGAMTQATVTVNAEWAVTPPVITDFINEYLFTQIASGSATRTVVVNTSDLPPVEEILVQNFIGGNLSTESVQQSLAVKNYGCFRTTGTTILRMADSAVASFGPALSPVYSFTDLTTGTQVSGAIPPGSYSALYGHYDFPAGYDPNAVAQSILNGTIPMMSYAAVIASGQTANLLSATINTDLFAGHTLDVTEPAIFQFDGNLDVISQAEFALLYAANPQSGYPTHLFNYMALSTCYASVAEANAAVGTLLGTVDFFALRNGLVALHLGTTPVGQSTFVDRFNATSTVRRDLPLGPIDAAIDYRITRMNGSNIATITDYTLTYCLMVRWGFISPTTQAYTTIPAGTVLTVTLPGGLLPYLYLAGVPYVQVPINGGEPLMIPIPDYQLSGNQLTLTVPVEITLQPDSICVPVKFLTPSDDLTSTFLSLAYSEPLVYTQDPDSLLYGFTTDSLVFRVTPVTTPFTLKGAQVDTTGLSVFPTVYDRGQAVTYIATVYNSSYAPDNDYCMSMTVPTNQYNPVETSNNTLPAYLTGVNLTNPNTVLYFQTAANATAMDISMMKTINRPGGPTLQQYFNTVIVNDWIEYTGQAFPAGVVMMVGCTAGVAQNSLVRIDYNVVMDLPAGDNTLYTNDAVFNYYSAGANLEAQSNMVTITNRIASPIPIIKTPPTQVHPLVNGVAVDFDAYFTAPADPLIFQTFTVTDTLHPGITLDVAATSVSVFPNTPVAHTLTVDPLTNTVSIEIPNTAATAGKLLIVHLATTVTDTTLIPIDPAYQLPVFYNTVSLTVNHDPALVSVSEPVIVLFQIPTPTPIPLVKAPPSQQKPRENGTPVVFTLSFDAPSETRSYSHFTLTDTLHPALTLDPLNVTVTASPNTPVPFTLNYQPVTKLVTIDFPNDALTAGKTITVTLATLLTDISLLPASNLIENTARLTLNQNPALYSDSNIVVVRFGDHSLCQALNDMIESVALEQTALSHILNAEGEKLQKALTLPLTPGQMLSVNSSVRSMVESVTRLEQVLAQKLELVICDPCEDC